MKINLVGAELFHADKTHRRTDMTKLTATFRNFANVPKNGFKKCYQPRGNFLHDKKYCVLAESHTNWNGGEIACASY